MRFNLNLTCEFFIISMFQGGNEMKKLLVSLLTLVMLTVSLSACTAAKVYKYGVGTVIAVTGQSATAEAAGKYGVNVDIVTVVVDKDGKIVSASWDVAQTSNLKFDAMGVVGVDVATYTKTKVEKGDEYGMKGASAIGKEWYEQAKALTDKVVGMTKAEVEAIAVDEGGYATDADIKAGTSMHITAFIEACAKAIDNAVEVKNVAKFGLGHTIAVTGANATAEAAGKFGVNVDLVVVALDKNDKVIYAKWDIAQCSGLAFDVAGVATADVTKFTKTKAEKGADYGMKGASAIGKEWFEQSAFMTDYVVSKKLDKAGIEAIALDAGYATDADLKAGVSIHISSFVPTIVEAITNAVAVK